MRIVILLIIINSLCIIGMGSAEELEQAKEQYREISARLESLQRNLTKNLRSYDNLRSEMAKLDKAIGGLHQEIRRSKSKISSSKALADKLEKRNQQLRADLARHDVSLRQQIRFAYLSQQRSKLKLMLSQNSLQDAGKYSVMYDYINRERINQIQQIEDLAHEIVRNRNQLIGEQKNLQTLVRQQTEQHSLLLDARAHKESAQQTLLHLIDEEQGKLKREQKNQAAVKQLLSKLQGLDAEQQRGSFGAQKGLLRWPLKGQLLNRFGALKSATANSKWDGVAIQATRGNEIRAIYSGIVVFADWFQGYGWMMIIDHGSDYMSLYAHAEGLNKNQGEQVQKGEVIALVGDSGSADKPHLYFEIRRQGAPVNPADWCKAPKLAYSAD